MEVFLDCGVFELVVLLALGYVINFVFGKKYLLVIFSVITIGCPLGLLFVHGRLHTWLAGVCIANAILLVFLLWRMRAASANHLLFDLDSLKKNVPALKRNAPPRQAQ
jgi:hypothetical protein